MLKRNLLKKSKRIIAIMMMALMMVIMIAPVSYAAEEDINLDEDVTLFVEFANGPKLSGMEFRAYRVATVDAKGNFTFTEAIASYGLVMPTDQAGYRALAETLSSYVARDGVNPAARTVTNGEGKASFGVLEQGLYLVIADKYTNPEDEMTYFVAPSLVALPNSTDGIKWNYDVTISPKYTSAPPVPSTGGEETEINVLKVWTGEADKTKRPTFVYAELICDGVVMDTVTLNSGNNWRYTWKNLDASKTYTVTEKDVPEGYTVTITRDGNTFTLNNYKGDVPYTPPQTIPKLPNTGQLWWPVPILAGIGLVLCVVGIKRKKQHNH